MKDLFYPSAIKRIHMKAKVFAQHWQDSKETQMLKSVFQLLASLCSLQSSSINQKAGQGHVQPHPMHSGSGFLKQG